MKSYKFDPIALAAKTVDAYSADSYASWPAVAKLLARLGYDERQAEAILRSKWTRWARDSWKGYPRTPTSTALKEFLDQYHYTPVHSDVIALTEESGFSIHNGLDYERIPANPRTL